MFREYVYPAGLSFLLRLSHVSVHIHFKEECASTGTAPDLQLEQQKSSASHTEQCLRSGQLLQPQRHMTPIEHPKFEKLNGEKNNK